MYKRFSSVVIPLVISNTINVKKDVISPDSFRKLQISIRLNYLVAKKNPEILIYCTIQRRWCLPTLKASDNYLERPHFHRVNTSTPPIVTGSFTCWFSSHKTLWWDIIPVPQMRCAKVQGLSPINCLEFNPLFSGPKSPCFPILVHLLFSEWGGGAGEEFL